MDLFNNCRLCRANCSEIDCYSISSTIDGVDIQEILTHTVPVDFSDDESLSMPRNICIQCFQTTSKAYELQKVALESDKYYREIHPFKVKSEDIFNVKVECQEYEYQEPVESFEITVFEDVNPPKRQRVSEESDDSVLYECNFCKKKMRQKGNMMLHLKLHDPKLYPLRCPKCVRRFDSEIRLESHLKCGHDVREVVPPIYECDVCSATASSKIGIENHLIDDHINKKSEPKRRKKYVKKIEDRLVEKSVTCEACNEEFPNKKEFSLHFMMEHEGIIRKLELDEIEINLSCCMCDEDQYNIRNLLDHANTHLEDFETFNCNICFRKLKTPEEFIKHSQYHTQPPTHKCIKCEKNFCYDENLICHLRKHKSEINFKIECKKCKQKLDSIKRFVIHDRVKHRQETLFICPICAVSMATSAGLDQHIRFIHNKEKEAKFQCRYCPKKFVVKNKLNSHEVTHSTERPHVCEICSRAFKHIDGLRKHMKRHNGTLPMNHVCSQCGYKCNSKHILENHMRSHTGLKPFECTHCDKAYALKGDLTKHLRKAHLGDKIYQCPQCPESFRLIVELREHQRDHLS